MGCGVGKRPPRHLAPSCLGWILHDGYAAPLLDAVQSHRTIIMIAAKNNPNDARTVHAGCSAKQRINRGTVAIFSWTAQNAHSSGFNGEMVVGTGNVDVASPDRLFIRSLGYW
jgi:hypothetical protein